MAEGSTRQTGMLADGLLQIQLIHDALSSLR